ncbi:MAG: TIGR02265 family protein [Myxococcales bacterium]|nr:TIGR02265 family protein [Myxococcales bacterium]
MSSATAVDAGPHGLGDLCAGTDLAWRLTQVPARAACRGVFFNMLDDRAAALGPSTQTRYRDFFAVYRYNALQLYPLADFLIRSVTLARLHFGTEHIGRGLREIQAAAFATFGGTMMGRAVLGLLRPELPTLLRAMERTWASGWLVNYSRFEIVEVTPARIVTRFTDEYLYIEHSMVGGLLGIAELAGERVEPEVRLTTPVTGEIHLHRGRHS